MLTPRRKTLLILIPLLIAFLFIGPIGGLELILWLALWAVWLFAFIVWGGKTPRTQRVE